MADPVECRIVIMMDESGGWRVAKLDDGLFCHGRSAMRRVDLTITMTPPVATELAITIPDDAGTTASVAVEG